MNLGASQCDVHYWCWLEMVSAVGTVQTKHVANYLSNLAARYIVIFSLKLSDKLASVAIKIKCVTIATNQG